MDLNIRVPNWVSGFIPKRKLDVAKNRPFLKGGYGFVEYNGEQESTLNKVVDLWSARNSTFNNNELAVKQKSLYYNKQNDIVFKLQPFWYLYENMYMSIPSVSAGVNKKSLAMGKLKSYFKDKNGNINHELTNEFCKLFRIQFLKQQISKQLDVFSTVIIKKAYNPSTKHISFISVPVSQTHNFFVNRETLEIESFSWNKSDIFSYERIERYDPKGNLNFYSYVIPDVSDQFFGVPKLQSAFTKLDMMLRDDSNYQLFLRNGSFPGIIAMVAGEQQDGLKADLDGFFRSMRDPDSKFKATVIANAVDSAGNPNVAFQNIKQSVENRLTQDEKTAIDGLVYDNLGLPRIIMGMSKSNNGIGANEYKPSMTMLKKDCYEPQAEQIEHIFNEFIIPEGLKSLEQNGYFDDKNYTAKDVEFELGQIDLADEEFEIKLERGEKLWAGGIITREELKLKYLNYKPSELTEEDKVYSIPAQVTIVEQGHLLSLTDMAFGYPTKEKPQVEQPQPKEETKPTEQPIVIKPKHIYKIDKSIFGEEQIRVFKSTKNRDRIKSFLEKTDKEKASKIPKLIKLPQATDEIKLISESLLSQYKNIDLTKVLAELGVKKKADTLQEDQIQQLADIISSELPANEIDTKKLVAALLFFARMGIDNTEQLTGLSLNKEQKDVVIKELNSFLGSRIDNLMNGLSEGETPDLSDITNPYYDGSLDKTTAIQIAVILFAIMQNNPNYSQVQVIEEFNKQAEIKTAERARIIVENNLAHTFNLAIYLTGLQMGSKGMMEWLHTTAKKPRNEHLELVGEMRLAKDFPVAPGVLINCQCSWTPKIDSPSEKQ